MAVQWRTPYDRKGDADVFAGEVVNLSLRLLQPDGAGGWDPQDLTGRSFVQRVYGSAGQILAQSAGVIAGGLVTFGLDGDVTAALLPTGSASIDLRHELAELFADGRDPIHEGAFRVSLGADPDAALPAPGGGLTGPATEFTVQQGAGGSSVVVRYQGAPGAPGSTRVELVTGFGAPPASNEWLMGFTLSQAVTVITAECDAFADSAATSAYALRFTREVSGIETEAFTIPFAAGAHTGSLANVPSILLPGRYRVRGAVVPDATFGQAAITLVGSR